MVEGLLEARRARRLFGSRPLSALDVVAPPPARPPLDAARDGRVDGWNLAGKRMEVAGYFWNMN